MIGTQEISNYLLGSSQVSKLYKGADLVWENGGSEPVLLQTIGVKFDDQLRTTIPGWNYWTLASTYELLNSSGVPSGLTMVDNGSNSWTAEDEGLQTDPDFPSAVLGYMVYTDGSSTQTLLRITGGNTARRYEFQFAVVQSYTDAGDSTSVTVNGVTQQMGGPNLANVVYKKTFIVDNPAGGILNIRFFPDPAIPANYGCMSGMIIKEYSL